ncbi:hypothetical protein WA026_019680 [Henosepilachna vigintioctopunctata]|uniref:Cytochrome P450 n=1 Tax=Henosepilachna vigintioctopunctata TaxID=420089 RepID=A0AAW1ULR9_9CUCU
MEKRVKETEESTDTNSTAEKENLDIHNPQWELSDSDRASQVFIFFLGDYDTVSTAMCFMVYELAANRDVQKKLYEEVIENRKDNNELLYETISFMTYLDMVVSGEILVKLVFKKYSSFLFFRMFEEEACWCFH